MIFAVVAYVGMALFFSLESFLRRGSEAKSLDVGTWEKGTTAAIITAYGIAALGGPAGRYLGVGQIPSPLLVGAIGLGLMIAGLLLRIWSMNTLGQFYTRTLRVTTDHRIVRAGPYRWVRHPGYLSSLFVWLGAGLLFNNWIVTAMISALMAGAYLYRIAAEESMLVAAFGDEYRSYQRVSWRLLPFLY